MNTNRIIFFSILTAAIIFGIVVHFTGCLSGLLPKGGIEMFYCQYGAVAVTLLCVFLAVRLFRKSIILRMALLEFSLLLDIAFWGIFGDDNPSFFYLAVICLIAFVFVFPAKEK